MSTHEEPPTTLENLAGAIAVFTILGAVAAAWCFGVEFLYRLLKLAFPA